MQNRKTVHIYGGGSAALIFASELAKIERYDIHIFERNKALGRKFLVAGKGGFNVTHDLNFDRLCQYYRPVGFMDPFLRKFDSETFRLWLDGQGISTYVGSSKRVFPTKGTKPIEVLQAIMKGLEGPNVHIHYNSQFVGFEDGTPVIQQDEKKINCPADLHIYSLGGASWSKTGSDGHWLEYFKAVGIQVEEFGAANGGLEVAWTKNFRKKHGGKHLKNIEIIYGNVGKKGEFTITDYGVEGNAVYPITSSVAQALRTKKTEVVHIDFKIQWTYDKILIHLANSISRGNSISDALRSLKFSEVVIDILKNGCTKTEWLSPDQLAHKIKLFPLQINGIRPIEECISTTGGIALTALDENLALKSMPNHYCLGEMIDWDAPTGGFLLQGCFSMGYYLAQRIPEM